MGTTNTANGKSMGINAGSNCEALTVAGSIWPVTEMAVVAMINPTNSEPESPKKSFAGCQLSGTNPSIPPSRMAVKSDA